MKSETTISLGCILWVAVIALVDKFFAWKNRGKKANPSRPACGGSCEGCNFHNP